MQVFVPSFLLNFSLQHSTARARTERDERPDTHGCPQLSSSNTWSAADLCPSSSSAPASSSSYTHVDGVSSGTQSVFLSVAGRDVIFGRILQGLPGPLKDSLIASELDDAAVLLNFPRSSPEELESALREERASRQPDPGSDLAPSGATSTTISRITSGQRRQPQAVNGGAATKNRPQLCSLG